MRGNPAELDLRRPSGLAQALDWLAEDPQLRPLAGGTDLMVKHEDGSLGPARLLDLSGLVDLRGIRQVEGELEIGAAVCYADLQSHPEVLARVPLLAQAAGQTGARAIQERGTLGGNLANASPAADSAPALIAHGAQLLLTSVEGTRRLPVEDFFLGYRLTALRPGELITALRFPPCQHEVSYFRKVGARRAQAISKVMLAATGRWTDHGLECRIGLGSVAAVTLRCRQVEDFLSRSAGAPGWKDAAARLLRDSIHPIDDVRSTAQYRRQVAGNLLLAFLRRAESLRPEGRAS